MAKNIYFVDYSCSLTNNVLGGFSHIYFYFSENLRRKLATLKFKVFGCFRVLGRTTLQDICA